MKSTVLEAEGSGSDSDVWQCDSDLDRNESFYVPNTSFTQKLTALDPSLYHGTGDDFSTEDNFDQTSAYINHQLSIYGFSSNLQFLKADKQNASRIVTALYKILQQHLKDTSHKEEMDLNWRRLSSDHDAAIQRLNTTKSQLEKAERETDILGGRVSALEDELRAETEKHRYTREELKSAKANLQYIKTQYAHEARKKEQEIHVLKEKLQKSINRSQLSSSTIPGGIKILNPVPRSIYGKQPTGDTEHLLRETIGQQQAKEAEIVEENEQLRRTLYTVHVQLEGLIQKHSLKDSVATPYGLPFDMIKDKIETEIRDTLTLLSDQWDHRPSLEPAISSSEIVVRDQRIQDLQKEVEKMQLELEESTLLVQGAQKMIDNLTSGNFLAGMQDLNLNAGSSDMTAQEIEEAEAKVQKQREELAKERKKFTEACIDLGKKRDELERDKMAFEESKRTFRLDKVMSFLSFSPKSENRIRTTPPSSPTPAPALLTPSEAVSTITHLNGVKSRKRVASSPLPPDFSLPGRSVRPKKATTVMELEDEEFSAHGVKQGTFHQNMDRMSATEGKEEMERDQEQEEEEEEELLQTSRRKLFNTMSDTIGRKMTAHRSGITDSDTSFSTTNGLIASKSKSKPGEGARTGFSNDCSEPGLLSVGRQNDIAVSLAVAPQQHSSETSAEPRSAPSTISTTVKPHPFTFKATPSPSSSTPTPIPTPTHTAGASDLTRNGRHPAATTRVTATSPVSTTTATTTTPKSSTSTRLLANMRPPRSPTPVSKAPVLATAARASATRGSSPGLTSQLAKEDTSNNNNNNAVTKASSSNSFGITTTMASESEPRVALINAAKIPSGFSKVAAHLAAKKSTARYPITTTTSSTSPTITRTGTSRTTTLNSRTTLSR